MNYLRLVRHLTAVSVLFVAAAHAATVSDDMKAVSTQACVDFAAQIDQYAPADKAKLPAYCACVTDTYWESVPQADVDGMALEYQAGNIKGPHATSINEQADARQQAASQMCGGSK